MKVRFQADADLNQIILLATIRREPAIDFQTAIAAGLSGIADPEVLARAANDGRVLVTHDRKTMPQHFSELIVREASPGLIGRCCINRLMPPDCKV
jgi:predicted nuclease of predicted toxin-antitoxin system